MERKKKTPRPHPNVRNCINMLFNWHWERSEPQAFFLVIPTINSVERITSTWRMNHKPVLTRLEPMAQGEGKISSYVLTLVHHNLEQTGRVHPACRYLYICSFFKFTSLFVEGSYPGFMNLQYPVPNMLLYPEDSLSPWVCGRL